MAGKSRDASPSRVSDDPRVGPRKLFRPYLATLVKPMEQHSSASTKRIWPPTCLALLMSLTAMAEGATVVGRVVSERGQGLAAEVRLVCAEDRDLTQSSPSGDFTMVLPEPLPVAGCYVEVVAPDHHMRVVGLDAFVASESVVELRLARARPVEELIVQGQRISRRFATSYIGALDAMANPSAHGDPLRAVATSPYSSSIGESPALKLRGNPTGAVSVFIDEVPAHEPLRGLDVEPWLTGTSSFGSGLLYDIEIYATNPPVFLANARSAAVRLIPPRDEREQSTIALLTTGIAVTHAMDIAGASLQASGGWSNMHGMLRLNPSLQETLESSRTRSASVRFSGKDNINLRGLLLVDDDRGAYPISILGSHGTWRNERRKSLGALWWEREIGTALGRVSVASTRSRGSGSYSFWDYASTRTFQFASVDVSSTAFEHRVKYRGGISGEAIRLRHSGQARRVDIVFSRDFPVGSLAIRDHELTHGGAYGFSTWDVTRQTTLMGGGRWHFGSSQDGKLSWQLGVARKSSHSNSTLRAVVGQYRAFAIPVPSDWREPHPFSVRQAALDYELTLMSADIAAGYFHARIEQPASKVLMKGFELAGQWQVTRRVSLRGALVRARQVVEAHGRATLGADDVDYLIRAGLDTRVGTATITVNSVHGSGRPYLEIVRGEASPINAGLYLPVFGDTARVGSYRRLDASLTMPIATGRDAKVLGLVALSNVLGQRNPRTKVYSPDFTEAWDAYYPGRVFVAGVIVLFSP